MFEKMYLLISRFANLDYYFLNGQKYRQTFINFDAKLTTL